ncbi:MAG: PKD domain-containing protein, partial [Phycisphaerae bacterium]|nr:PKD domain-containing protein [Phycisphaerae bacterium]
GNVFHGNNIFGPSGRTITRYTGFLQIPANGDYGFATSSDDASFLLIDGKAVVEWGGYHGWVGDARHNRTIALAAGIHEFEYLHVNVAGDGGCVAAWKPPGSEKWVTIPSSAFLPVHRAFLRERERFGGTRSADLTWRNIGETVIGDDDYIQRFRMTSNPAGFDAKAATFTWDFGDGTAANGEGLNDLEHVYLLDGPVDVTVTVTQGTLKDSVTNRMVVSRDWRWILNEKLDPLAAHLKIVQTYDLARMKPATLARAMELFRRARANASYVKAGHLMATSAEPVDDKMLVASVKEYAEFLMANEPDGAAKAVDDFVAAAKRAQQPFTRAALYVGAGRVCLDRLGNDPKAEQWFAEALKFADRGNDRSIKAAWIGMGDVYRRRGDGEKALAAYESAEKMQPAATANRTAVEVGSLSRTIEFYIRQGEWEAARKHLEEWDWQFPTQKLHGYSTLLWVRFYQGQKMHKEAIQEANDLVGAAERSNYAPQLLLAAADSWVALRNAGNAKKLLEHVIAVYKDSPLVSDAKKKLAELGG